MAELAMDTFCAIRLFIGSNVEAMAYARFTKLQERTRAQAVKTKQTAGLRPVVGFALLALFVWYGWTLAGLFEEKEWTRGYPEEQNVEVTHFRVCMEAFIYAAIFLHVFAYQSGKLAEGQNYAVDLMKVIQRKP
mmetsp:Transcript_30914/g.38206  ORF Transcript_30914/g.38206 Transcript_30914/m.38206 type:complete len:134 (-) Transcript_30914:1888-2289(-)